MTLDSLHRIRGKKASRSQIEQLSKLALSEGYGILSRNLKTLLFNNPQDSHFLIENIKPVNLINDSDMEGMEFSTDPEIFGVDGLGKTESQKIYDKITKMVIDLISKNPKKLFWEKPWKDSHKFARLMNFVSKKPYHGTNAFLLEILYPVVFGKNWTNPYFLTKTQIKTKKGKLKPKSKAYPIMFYTIGYRYVNQSEGINIIAYNKGKFIAELSKVKSRIKLLKGGKFTLDDIAQNSSFSIVKGFDVYNGEDIEGIDFKIEETKIETTFTPIGTAETVVEVMPKKPKITFGGSQAVYIPTKDTVNMPPKPSFSSEQKYYATLFHELIHSTGNKKRLGRSLKGAFGSLEYAYEELIAELGASFLTAECGILNHHIKNTAAYIESWNTRIVKKLKDDNTFIFRASAQAQKAADFILDVDKNGVPKYRKKAVRATKKKPEPVKPKTAKKQKPSAKLTKAKGPKVNKKTGQTALFGPGELPDLFQTPGQEIKRENIFRLPGQIGEFMQDLQRFRLAVALRGDTHGGKTQFLMQLINGFLDLDMRVGYFDLEQGGLSSKDTQETIERNLKAENRQKLAVAGEVPEGFETIRDYAKKGLFDVIAVDSWQKLQVPNTRLDELRSEFPDIIFIIVFQQNAEGGTRGGVSADFDAPIVIKVHKVDSVFINNYAELIKNRGNEIGLHFNIAAKKIVEPKTD